MHVRIKFVLWRVTSVKLLAVPIFNLAASGFSLSSCATKYSRSAAGVRGISADGIPVVDGKGDVGVTVYPVEAVPV